MTSEHKHTKRLGFTLIELSIVIIIIGLLIAGIAAGQSMIRQAIINSIIDDFYRFQTADRSFVARYGTLPGDFANAWAFWGPNCGGGDPNICNGDGNGVIDGLPAGNHEDLTAWEHLSLAGMINEKMEYTGGYDIGISMPKSKNGGQYWHTPFSSFSEFALGKTGRTDGAPYPNASAISPADASAIDRKIDDGRPGTGPIQASRSQDRFHDPTICTSLANDDPNYANSVYLLDDQTTSCSLLYNEDSKR